VPDSLLDGDYDVRIGLFLPAAGRLPLQGRNDGQDRIRAGTLQLRDGGRTLSFEPEPPATDGETEIYQHRLNLTGKPLDFGDVRTDGSILVRRENDEWVLRALPRMRNFHVELNTARFGRPETVRCVGGSEAETEPQIHGDWWWLKLNGAREYHWK
jgi:hypothetical protein